MRRALASSWCSAPETCPLWCPFQPLANLGRSTEISVASGLQAQLLAHPPDLGLPGSPAQRSPGAGVGSGPGAGERGPPRLRTVVPGLGAGATPPSLRSLDPALLPAPGPPPRPEPSHASAVQAPHCRSPPAASRSAVLAVPLRSARPPSASCALAAPEGPWIKPPHQTPRVQSLRQWVEGIQGDCGCTGARALSDAAGQADRLPEARREMSEAAGWRRQRRRRHHPEQRTQEAQLYFPDRAPAALHLGAG